MRTATRFALLAALLSVGLLIASQADAAAQGAGRQEAAIRSTGALEAAVRAADGVARFQFAARPGVWGNGRTWNLSRDLEDDGNRAMAPGRHCDGCTNGPIRVTVRVENGVETRVRSQVGGDWKKPGRDLGSVRPGTAADYLLALVERRGSEPDGSSKEEALQAAVSAAAGETEFWPRLLAVAQDRAREADVRKAALFWTAHEAGVRAAGAIEDIVVAEGEETEVQEAAVFALTQLPEDRGTRALLRLARQNRNPDVVRSVYFWLGQRDDPRVLALFEEVLLD